MFLGQCFTFTFCQFTHTRTLHENNETAGERVAGVDAPPFLSHRLPPSSSSTPATLTASFSMARPSASRPTTRARATASGSTRARCSSNSFRAERRSASRHGVPLASGHVKAAVARRMARYRARASERVVRTGVAGRGGVGAWRRGKKVVREKRGCVFHSLSPNTHSSSQLTTCRLMMSASASASSPTWWVDRRWWSGGSRGPARRTVAPAAAAVARSIQCVCVCTACVSRRHRRGRARARDNTHLS